MFISSTKEGMAAQGTITVPNTVQKTEFSRILNKQVSGWSKSIHAAVSMQESQKESTASLATNHIFQDTISKHRHSISSLLTIHPLYGIDPPDDFPSKISFDKPALKMQKGSGTVETDKDASVPNNGLRAEGKNSQGIELLLLGTVSKSNPTVSDLMVKHPTYGKDCWEILHSNINRDKAYTTIPSGSHIYLNPETREIVWNRKVVSGNRTQTAGNTPKDAEPIFLGTISKSDPTVSNLMIKHPAYGKECWSILHSSINRDKAYTTIPSGSRIYLNPETHEIVWNGNKGTAAHTVQTAQIDLQPKQIQSRESDPFSAGLAKAVEPYLGKPYEEINCFELVAQGLEGIGIQYYGRGGLGNRLVQMATEKGLSSNHYLSGEGLIETSGSQIYSKSVPRIRDSKTEALKAYQEVEPLLHEGLILSFSTPTRGHTGIISQKKHNWTYINSGRMDHRIQGRASKGVGEEFLNAEIRNWFRLAANRSEPLQITLGRLDENKLRAVLTDKQVSLTGTTETLIQRQ